MSPKLRRQAGERGQEQLTEQVISPFFYIGGITAATIALISAAWLLPAITPLSASWGVTITGGVLIVLAGCEAFRIQRRSHRIVRGIFGERLTADAIESLRPLGDEVFHDLADETPDGRPCNVDHVIVGPGGIFVVETKFRSMAFDGKSIAVFPDKITIDGRQVEPDPRQQVLAALASVRGRLEPTLAAAGNACRAVVVFPRRKGGGIDNAFRSPDGVWVLTPPILAKALRNQRAVLTADQVRQVCTMLGPMARQDSYSRSSCRN